MENKEVLIVRLKLRYEEDQPLYNNFKEIKEKLGLKSNTEVARYCIKKAYEVLFISDE